MNIYKFRDTVDGRFAYVIAWNLTDAENALRTQTSIPFEIVKSGRIELLHQTAYIIKNDILPF